MSIGREKRKTKPRKPDDTHYVNCFNTWPPRCARPVRRNLGTPAGAAAKKTITGIQWEERLRTLTEKVSLLERLIDPLDVAAYHELRLITPTAEEFAQMSPDEGSPPCFEEAPDDEHL
jgi:hypothetical protein